MLCNGGMMDNLYNDYCKTARCNHKCKEFPVGSVAYFIKYDERSNKFEIKFGIVEEHYSNETILQLYSLKTVEKINGIPTDEIDFPTQWEKLPKDYSHDTQLFEHTVELDRRGENVFINSPESIIKGIEDGILIEEKQNYDCCYKAEFSDDKDTNEYVPRDCYRIQKKWLCNHYEPTVIGIKLEKLFHTYEQAKEKARQIQTERQKERDRINNLTDYEYVVEEIERVVSFFKAVCGVSDKKTQEYKEWLLSLDNLEKVEVRFHFNCIQWRYVTPPHKKLNKPNKWKEIELGDYLQYWSDEAIEKHFAKV